jgi:hypothetical protein
MIINLLMLADNHVIWPSPTVLTTQDNTIPIHHVRLIIWVGRVFLIYKTFVILRFQTIDSGIRPMVNIIRPTVVDGRVSLPVNGNLIPTSVLRPVMTTSIVSSNTILKRQVCKKNSTASEKFKKHKFCQFQPILLPKPTVSGASMSFQNVSSSITTGSVASPNFGQMATPTVGGTIKLTKVRLSTFLPNSQVFISFYNFRRAQAIYALTLSAKLK